MLTIRSVLAFASLSFALQPVAACGSGSTGGATFGDGGGGDGGAQINCFDVAAKATPTCALTPKGSFCALGDANHCVPLVETDVYADDGKSGVCLHLIFSNQCAEEVYSDTCIEHIDPKTAKASWQCWTSSTLQGASIDVSQCHATGNFFEVSSTSSGQLDILEQKCAAPH